MERKTLSKFLKWKNKKNRKPLLVTGVRQCGKTYIIKEFGKSEFEDIAYFNFERLPAGASNSICDIIITVPEKKFLFFITFQYNILPFWRFGINLIMISIKFYKIGGIISCVQSFLLRCAISNPGVMLYQL